MRIVIQPWKILHEPPTAGPEKSGAAVWLLTCYVLNRETQEPMEAIFVVTAMMTGTAAAFALERALLGALLRMMRADDLPIKR
jgi:hypothetical protein